MKHLARLFLAIAMTFFTPAGVYVCGCIAPGLLPEAGTGMTVLCDGSMTMTPTDTAVTTYLSTPFLAVSGTAVLDTMFLVQNHQPHFLLSKVPKRKPLTPPPYFVLQYR